MSLIDIIIPTYDSPQYLYPCVESLLGNRMTLDLFKIIVVNNGHPENVKELVHKDVTVLQMKENKGWEGGLKEGLAISKAPFVVFCNDDILIPSSSALWANRMIQHFRFPDCAAVGPSSNCVSGAQSIFANVPFSQFRSSFLIGFFMMLRRSHLDQAGGVDDSLPYHGDDFDLSIRLRKAGKYLVVDKDVFVFHHGFKTGQKVFGGYWNSADMREKTNFSLINKHGLAEWLQTNQMQFRSEFPESANHVEDMEGNTVRKYIVGEHILEIGCGPKKTVENAVGVDITPKGEEVPGLFHELSQADVVADVSQEIPVEKNSFDTVIARHIMEHMIDPIEAIHQWGSTLKHGGRLIIAVPNQDIQSTIPLNHEHVHAYTPTSLKNFMESLGWKTETIEDTGNFISFVGVFTKNGVQNGHR